jgi:hypothetical protein
MWNLIANRADPGAGKMTVMSEIAILRNLAARIFSGYLARNISGVPPNVSSRVLEQKQEKPNMS